MPNIGKWPGRLHFVAVADSSDAVQDISNDVKTFSGPSNAKPVDVSGGGDARMTYVVGQLDNTIQIEGPFNTNSNRAHAVFAGIVGGTAGKLVTYGPAGSHSGYPKYSGSAFCTVYDVKSDVADAVRYTATLVPADSSGITWGTFS